jgi:hypothetical protein
MGIISQAADTYYTYRFLRTLVTKWEDQEAYKYGIIDDKGKVLRKSSTLRTTDEKASFTYFHRLVFNLKRILEKLPFGKSQLASYAAALFLLKEETEMSEDQIRSVLNELDFDLTDDLTESYWNVDTEGYLSPGVYSLNEDIASPSTGEMIAVSGTKVIIPAMCEAVDHICGVPIYKVKHQATKTDIYITPRNIVR